MGRPPLGSGARFRALEEKLAGEKGVYNPAGLAAAIGRRRYGKKKFAALSAHGRVHAHMKAKRG